MEALWVIIFIVFILVRVFNNIPGMSDKRPRDWEKKFPGDWEERLPPILRDMGFPWDGNGNPERGRGQVPGSAPGPAPRSAPGPEKRAVKRPISTEQSGRDTGRREPPALREEKAGISAAVTADDTGITYIDGRDCELQQHPLFGCQAVVNGIIFSELLQPPKCKRRR